MDHLELICNEMWQLNTIINKVRDHKFNVKSSTDLEVQSVEDCLDCRLKNRQARCQLFFNLNASKTTKAVDGSCLFERRTVTRANQPKQQIKNAKSKTTARLIHVIF